MNKVIQLSTFLLFCSLSLMAQDVPVPRFAKYQINETKRFAYFPDDPGEFEVVKSKDGSEVYWGEVAFGDYYFLVILVEFAEIFAEDTEDEEMENLLVSYLDYLQLQFQITSAAGLGKGHRMDSNPHAIGVIDYWEDADAIVYAVKGWIDKDAIAVMILYGPEEFPHFNAQQLFLNGFRFE